MRAVWKDIVLAESDSTVVVEGNHYFPADSLKREYFVPSDTRPSCPWKGLAHYYSIVTTSGTNTDAAWYYPAPKPAASAIEGRVAFWRGVAVTE
jgi:uncharacterized protein (DUF427 family)